MDPLSLDLSLSELIPLLDAPSLKSSASAALIQADCTAPLVGTEEGVCVPVQAAAAAWSMSAVCIVSWPNQATLQHSAAASMKRSRPPSASAWLVVGPLIAR